MTIDEARTWLQRHADNTPMPGAMEAYRTILEELQRTRWIPVTERLPEKQGWYHVVILDTKTNRKVVEQDLFAVELAEKYRHYETAVNIVKHSLTYLEGDGLTYDAMTYAIERVAMTDLTRWDLSNAELQRALRWLFDHYDFK